jgi:hypothetical protein
MTTRAEGSVIHVELDLAGAPSKTDETCPEGGAHTHLGRGTFGPDSS